MGKSKQLAFGDDLPMSALDALGTPLRSPRVRELADKAQELAKLKEHPSWEILRAEFEKRKQGYLRGVAQGLMAGGPDAPAMDQRRIDYERGFLRGAQAVLDTPDNALAQLEAELRKEPHVGS